MVNSETVADLKEADVEVTPLLEKCRDFYTVVINLIKKRFVFQDEFYDVIQMVHPCNARTATATHAPLVHAVPFS